MSLFAKKAAKKNVLIVEDDALLCHALSEGISHAGHVPVCVGNGQDVLPAVQKKAPDIILLDLILPGLDGFAILKALKSDTKTASIPVAIISNLDSMADVKSAKSLGAETSFIKANTGIAEIVEFVNKATK